MDWINLAQSRGKWHAVVNMATKLRVPLNAENCIAAQSVLQLVS
jgi:hypothetical protein